jgi:hypothetical protein
MEKIEEMGVVRCESEHGSDLPDLPSFSSGIPVNRRGVFKIGAAAPGWADWKFTQIRSLARQPGARQRRIKEDRDCYWRRHFRSFVRQRTDEAWA